MSVTGALSAAAADVSTETDEPTSGKQYVLDLGVGVEFKPKYPGADDYIVFPFPIIGVGRFYVPGFGDVVDGQKPKRGFYFFPDFDFNGERKASDSSDLRGTNKVDWAVEVGAGIGYRYDWILGFASIRQGFNGHKGQVASFGIDFVADPTDRINIAIGPRASWASKDYMRTYFGVTPGEAAAPGSILTAYKPGSGFKTVGAALRASYDLTDTTTLHLRGRWDRFIGDADDSPIVKVGSENQFTIGVGASYRFAFDVFD
ncbi:MAG: MipA/OmpV family protein [Hyphomicrobiales bacterium]